MGLCLGEQKLKWGNNIRLQCRLSPLETCYNVMALRSRISALSRPFEIVYARLRLRHGPHRKRRYGPEQAESGRIVSTVPRLGTVHV